MVLVSLDMVGAYIKLYFVLTCGQSMCDSITEKIALAAPYAFVTVVQVCVIKHNTIQHHNTTAQHNITTHAGIYNIAHATQHTTSHGKALTMQ